MASKDRLDVFSLATEDPASLTLLQRMRFPALFGALGLIDFAAILAMVVRPSALHVGMAVGATALTGALALWAKRRWAPIRHRIANAILNDSSPHLLRKDWLPHERKAAKAAVREFRRLPEKKLTWKESLGELGIWPFYVLFLTRDRDTDAYKTWMLLVFACAWGVIRGWQTAYRADVLRPLLARMAREQLAKIEAATADESASETAPAAAQDSTPTAEQRKAVRGIAAAQ